MRYYLDTEFNESRGKIKLISIGIVSQEREEFYAESLNFSSTDCNEWVKANVFPSLMSDPFSDRGNILLKDPGITRMIGTNTDIGKQILEFIGDDRSPEFYGYFADYDWVVFCWLYGAMIDLPNHFPYYCIDLKQILDERGIKKIADPEGEHNALVDARWNRDLHQHILKEAYDNRM
jgi:hypothetical protein